MFTTTTTAPNEILDAEMLALCAPTQADQPGFFGWFDEVQAEDDDETQYLRSLAGSAKIFIEEEKESVGGRFELFPEYED